MSHVAQPDARRLEIHFTDDSILLLGLLQEGFAATLTANPGAATTKGRKRDLQPTRRQREYLEFIARYILRFGVSPAESDIERHFLVSAPSVNQMVQTLERRGFITRQRGVPRSIRLVYPTSQHVPQQQHSLVSGTRRSGSRTTWAGAARPHLSGRASC
ncbi:MAG: LexA family protein [Candidatus Rokuibacteriota bacterium]